MHQTFGGRSPRAGVGRLRVRPQTLLGPAPPLLRPIRRCRISEDRPVGRDGSAAGVETSPARPVFATLPREPSKSAAGMIDGLSGGREYRGFAGLGAEEQERLPVLPNFLGIACFRCGSTWLHHLLDQHPDVFVPRHRREINFFRDGHYHRRLGWYERFFPRGDDACCYQAVGDVGPRYIHGPRSGRPRRCSPADRRLPGCLSAVLAFPDGRHRRAAGRMKPSLPRC